LAFSTAAGADPRATSPLRKRHPMAGETSDAPSSSEPVLLQDLPLEVLTHVCQHLGLVDLVHFAQSCRRFRHGDGGLETLELPTKSPVIACLREHAFSRPELVPPARPVGCSESWVAYLARCKRQRRYWEALPIKAAEQHSLFINAAGRLLACGEGFGMGHGDEGPYHDPTPVAAMAGVRVRSVAACYSYSLALGWDGRFYSWGENHAGQLGQGDTLARPVPTPVEGLEGVRGVATSNGHSLAVTESGAVFSWGGSFWPQYEDALSSSIVDGFGEVSVRRVYAGDEAAFAIGEKGELFSWGRGKQGLLGHGDTISQYSPKRVEALQGVRMSCVSIGYGHALALAEDGLVYTWCKRMYESTFGNADIERELLLLPKPVEALRGVRVGSIAAGGKRSYAVADTGEVWAWGPGDQGSFPLGLASRRVVLCPSRLSRCGASRWMQWLPTLATRWRWRPTGASTRGAANVQQNWVHLHVGRAFRGVMR
jgi:hypothetical protein